MVNYVESCVIEWIIDKFGGNLPEVLEEMDVEWFVNYWLEDCIDHVNGYNCPIEPEPTPENIKNDLVYIIDDYDGMYDLLTAFSEDELWEHDVSDDEFHEAVTTFIKDVMKSRGRG